MLHGLPMDGELAVQHRAWIRARSWVWAWLLASGVGAVVTVVLIRFGMGAGPRLALLAALVLWLWAVALGWSWARRVRRDYRAMRRGQVHRMGRRIAAHLDHNGTPAQLRLLAEFVVDAREARWVLRGLVVLDVLALTGMVAAAILAART